MSKDDKSPIIPFDRQMYDLYELAQDKENDAIKAQAAAFRVFNQKLDGYCDNNQKDVWHTTMAGARRRENETHFDEGFAFGVIHTLDWIRGDAPYPFEIDDPEDVLIDDVVRETLRPTANELLAPGSEAVIIDGEFITMEDEK